MGYEIACNTSSTSEPRFVSLAGQCEWSALNSILASLLFLMLLLNLLAAVVIFQIPLISQRGRSNPVYLCIRFLNVIDITQASLLLVMPAFADGDCNWLGGEAGCKAWGFAALSLLLVSPLITIVMALDRVIALYRPFKYRSNFGLQVLKFLLPSSCAIVCVITVLPLVGVGEYHVVRGRRMCLLDTIVADTVDQYYVIMVHSVFLLSLLFMVGCTLAFQLQLSTLSSKKKFQTTSSSSMRSSGRSTRNATVTTMAICCIFVTCYTPYVVRILVETSTGWKSGDWITWVTFGLAFTQPLLNPVVYLGTNAKCRHKLMMMLKRIKRSDVNASSDSITMTSRVAVTEYRRRSSNYNSRRSSKQSNAVKRKETSSASFGQTTNHIATCEQTTNQITSWEEKTNQIAPDEQTTNQISRIINPKPSHCNSPSSA